MQHFWSVLAVQLGKRAGLVSVVGLLVTIVLGLGITQLEFATGQDSYLNKDDQVYIDNVAYQDLFGGQAMLTVISMDDGHTVDELFTAENRAQLEAFDDALMETGDVHGVITPLTILEFSDSLIASPDGDPTHSIAGAALQTALGKETPESPEHAARAENAFATIGRLNAVPEDQRTFDNPAWVEFLLYDNEGEIRKAHRSFILDDSTAQIIVRLPGNESIEVEGAASDLVLDQADELSFANASVVTTGAPILLKDINDYLRGGMLTLGAIAVAIMVVILLVLFNVRWRLLPLFVILVGVVWAFGLAGYLGIPLTIVTIAGLPVMLGVGIDYAIQMHAARRGGSGPRSRRAPYPRDVAQPRPRAARRDVRRDLRVPRAAVRRGSDDPRLRTAARGRHRCDLSVFDRSPTRDPRHPRAPLTHDGQGLPPRRPRADHRLPRPAATGDGDPARHRERRHLLLGHRGRGRSDAADRSGAVGRPRLPSDQGPPRGRGADGLVERARRVRAERRRVHRRVRQLRARVHARPSREQRR